MTETKNCKIIGFQAPRHLTDYLSLYIYHRGFTKSKVLKQALSSWFLETQKVYPEEELIKQITNDAQQAWNCLTSNTMTKSERQNTFANYKHEIAKDMREKGVTEEIINKVLTGIEV